MASTSSRMLRLLSLLQTHRFWSGLDLASRLEVSERTLRRDVDRLRELGYPVDATRGHSGGYQLQAGAALPPLLVDDEEAVAIALGLSAAAGGSVAGIEESALRALTKVVSVMPVGLRRRMEAVASTAVQTTRRGPGLDAAVLTTLAQGCRDHERIRFDYTGRTESDLTRRHVEPHSVVSLDQRWYLVAFDLDRRDWRTFRVDRVASAESSRTRVPERALPDGIDSVEFVRRSRAAIPRRHEIQLLIRSDPSTVARTVMGWGYVDRAEFPGAPGEPASRVTLHSDDLVSPMWLLAAIDAEFVVESPTELVNQIHQVGQRFTAATSHDK